MIVPLWIPITLILAGLGLTLWPSRDDTAADDHTAGGGGDSSGEPNTPVDGHGGPRGVAPGQNNADQPTHSNRGDTGDDSSGQSHSVEIVHPPKPVATEHHVDETPATNDTVDDGDNVASEHAGGKESAGASGD